MNKKIAIITDSSTGLKNNELPDVFVIPLIVTATTTKIDGQKEITTYHDGVDINNEKIAELQKNSNIELKTSQASIGEAMDLVEKINDDYDEIFVLPIASSVSGSENTWQIVAEDYPKLKVIRQHMGGPMLKFIIYDFLAMKKNNLLTMENINKYIENAKQDLFGMLLVWDPRKVAKGGRVRNMAGAALSMLKLKLSVSLDENGMKLYKIFTSVKSGIKRCFSYFEEKYKNFSLNNIKRLMFIRNKKETKANDISNAINMVKDKLSSNNIKCEIYDKEIMPSVLISHTGSDALIIAVQMKR